MPKAESSTIKNTSLLSNPLVVLNKGISFQLRLDSSNDNRSDLFNNGNKIKTMLEVILKKVHNLK